MKQLFNYCPVHWYEKEMQSYPGGVDGYLQANKMDGLELYVYGTEGYPTDYSKQAVGTHLKFWPYWLDFWRGDKAALLHNFGSEQDVLDYYYGARDNGEWLAVMRKNVEASLLVKPKYFVWHVAHCDFDEIFTWNFKYTDAEVIDATIEIVNAIADSIPDDVTVLFENLWWPGLKLTDPSMVDRLFSGIKKNNVGIMLDTGHLMNTNINLTNEAEGVDYICSVAKQLGMYKNYIKGMHLSCSLSGAYLKAKSWDGKVEKTPAFMMHHITQIDQHKNFKEEGLGRLIACLEPEYVVHELFYDTMVELAGYLKVQSALLEK
ncbi:MAG: TIM barrel protein [Phascolarctobacterium sp.]|nr:TIM barrel protein [Phascolarctobacterium sp.]